MARLVAIAVAFVLIVGTAAEATYSLVYTTDGSETVLVEATPPVDSTKAPFRWEVAGANFGGVFDSVSYLGYNVAGAGGKVIAGEPMLSWNIEQDYLQGTQRTMETYWEFVNADGTRSVRPIFLQFNRDTGNVNRFTFAGNSFGFQRQPTGRYDDAAPWLWLYPGAIQINPSSDAPAQLIMGTPAGQPSVISMTWGGQQALSIVALRPNDIK